MTDIDPKNTQNHSEQKTSKVSQNINIRFHCDYPDCDKSYIFKHKLVKHVLIQHKNHRFKCDYPPCRKEFTSKRNLKRHASLCHKITKCEYPDCEKSFNSKESLIVHVSVQHNNQKLKCIYPECKKEFASKQILKRHVSWNHEKTKFKCKFLDCDKLYTAEHELKLHVLEHVSLHNQKLKVRSGGHIGNKNCRPNPEEIISRKISVLEKHLEDIDLRIKTVSALISDFESVFCDECCSKKEEETFQTAANKTHLTRVP